MDLRTYRMLKKDCNWNLGCDCAALRNIVHLNTWEFRPTHVVVSGISLGPRGKNCSWLHWRTIPLAAPQPPTPTHPYRTRWFIAGGESLDERPFLQRWNSSTFRQGQGRLIICGGCYISLRYIDAILKVHKIIK